MDMTFQQYIDNPMGKKNAVFSQRQMYKDLYTQKFDNLVLREAGKINYTLYIDEKRDRYVAHIKIPSETVKNFYYDAVIYFYTSDAAIHSSPSLNGYNIKFFSNDPAFVFTYLRVFFKNDLFFEDLKPRASKKALREDPKVTNPYETPGYSKILYFAFLFMKGHHLFNKTVFKQEAKPYDKKVLLKMVMDTDEKIAKRQELGAAIKKDNDSDKGKKEKPARTPLLPSSLSSGNVKLTKSVGRTKTVGSVKTTKTTKGSKRK